MTQELLWTEVCKLLKDQAPNAGSKFTELLVKAKEERLSILTKTVEFLNSEGHELIYVSGICTFIQSILKLMIHSYQLNFDAVCDMLNFIIVEARHFSTTALVKNVTYCLDYMKTNDEVDLPVRWIEVFGKIVAVLATRGEIDVGNDIIDGQEYKQQVISEICRINWNQHNGASLIAALREIPGIDSQDTKIILEKVTTTIGKLEPTSIPPMAYQLLLLAGSTFPSVVVQHFDDYFSGVDFGPDDNTEDSTLVSKKKALGTTVYHFVQGARQSEPLLKELMKRIKASQFHHSLVISPFMMSVAMGLTGIDYVKPVIIEAVKTTILKWFTEIHLSKNIRWYYEVRGAVMESVTSCFIRAIDSRTSELDFMLDGLKELGIGLLNTDLVGAKDNQLEKKQCSSVGDYLLTSMVSKEKDYLPVLMNEFLKNQNSVTNIACLGHCLKKVVSPFVRKKFVGRITELIHHLPLMTVETAIPILKALLPALQLSYDLLGEVVMVLRKTIWKSVEARRISVTAMILLLSNSRIVGNIPRSQYSNTQEFSSSQLSDSQTNILGSSNKNESICFEVLSILKRFFTQQVEVREHLYIGLYNVARQNPELISFLCSHVMTQIQQHMANSDSIQLNKVLEFSSGQTVLLEPLGFLVQCLCCLLIKSRKVYGKPDGDWSDGTPTSVTGCADLIPVWISAVRFITYEDFNKLTSKILPTGQTVETSYLVKAEFTVQVMQVIEALIEYLCLDGESSDPKDLPKLFDKFNELTIGLKPPTTTKKGKSKKKPSKDKSNADSTLQLSVTNSSNSDFQLPKAKEPTLKKVIYTHIMAIEHLCEIFSKMNESTTHSVGFEDVKDNTEFNLFLMTILKQKLNKLKHNESIKEREKDVKIFNDHLAKIAHYLWKKADRRLEDDVEAVQLDADELCLELTAEIIEYLFLNFTEHRQASLARFLNEENQQKSYSFLFARFFKQFTRQMRNIKKYVLHGREGKGVNHLIKILELFALELTTEETELLTSVMTWFSEFMKPKACIFGTDDDSPIPPQLVESTLNAFISIGSKLDIVPAERFLPLAKLAHYYATDIDAETNLFAPESEDEQVWLITPKTSNIVLHHLALYTENTLGIMKDIIGRLNCVYIAEEKVTTWRNSCCNVMMFLMKLLTHLVRSKFPVGPWVDVLRRTVVQFFNVMASITETFVSFHSKNSEGFRARRFEALVRAIGMDFKIRAEAMVHHIEGIRRKALEAVEDKKKGTNSLKFSIAKDTRTLPALVYSIEKYELQLIVLCQKTKVNLLAGTRLSAPRDFRIMYNNLKKTAVVDASTNDEGNSTSKSARRGGTNKNISRNVDPNSREKRLESQNTSHVSVPTVSTLRERTSNASTSGLMNRPSTSSSTASAASQSTSTSRPGPLSSKAPNSKTLQPSTSFPSTVIPSMSNQRPGPLCSKVANVTNSRPGGFSSNVANVQNQNFLLHMDSDCHEAERETESYNQRGASGGGGFLPIEIVSDSEESDMNPPPCPSTLSEESLLSTSMEDEDDDDEVMNGGSGEPVVTIVPIRDWIGIRPTPITSTSGIGSSSVKRKLYNVSGNTSSSSYRPVIEDSNSRPKMKRLGLGRNRGT